METLDKGRQSNVKRGHEVERRSWGSIWVSAILRQLAFTQVIQQGNPACQQPRRLLLL
jgi:hypothetical protein